MSVGVERSKDACAVVLLFCQVLYKSNRWSTYTLDDKMSWTPPCSSFTVFSCEFEKLRVVVLLSRTYLRRDMFAAIGVLSSVQPCTAETGPSSVMHGGRDCRTSHAAFFMPLRTFCFRLLYRWCTKPDRVTYGIECHHIVKMLLIMLRIVKTSLFKVLDKVINYDSFQKMVVYCYAAIRYSKHTFCKNF